MNRNTTNSQRQISFNMNNVLNINFFHTYHSYQRAAQRGFDQHKLSIALEYGEGIFKQGLIYYVLGEHNIPDALAKEKSSLKNTVVVVAGDSGQVVTCYRSNQPFKNVKAKNKNLSK